MPNRTLPRRVAPAEERREQILRAARRIFAESGYRGTQIESVADALRIGKGTVYRYFDSKKKLFIAVANRAMQEMGESTARGARAEQNLVKKIALAMRGQLEFIDNNPDVVEILLQERTEFRDEFTPTYIVYRDANLSHLEAVLREGMSQGLIRRMSVTAAANMLCDLIYGIIMVGYMRKERRLGETGKDAIEMAFNGLLTPEGQATARFRRVPPPPPYGGPRSPKASKLPKR